MVRGLFDVVVVLVVDVVCYCCFEFILKYFHFYRKPEKVNIVYKPKKSKNCLYTAKLNPREIFLIIFVLLSILR